jgi:hypothetical protein
MTTTLYQVSAWEPGPDGEELDLGTFSEQAVAQRVAQVARAGYDACGQPYTVHIGEVELDREPTPMFGVALTASGRRTYRWYEADAAEPYELSEGSVAETMARYPRSSVRANKKINLADTDVAVYTGRAATLERAEQLAREAMARDPNRITPT